MEDWRDIFASPEAWVGVSFEIPAWVGSLTVSGSPEVLSLEVSEMSPGEAASWARDGGWAAFGTRVRAVASVLGGEAELQTFKSRRGERHEVRYVGPKVVDL